MKLVAQKSSQTKLAVLMSAYGLTVDAVASRLSVSPQYLSSIACGSRLPSAVLLRALGEFFAVNDPAELLTHVSSAELVDAMRVFLNLGE